MIVPNQITVPVRIGTVVRDFGTILFGLVRGTKFWYETQWFGSGSDSWFVISGPLRNGIFQKIVFFFEPNRLRIDLFGTKSVRSEKSVF